MYEMKYDFEGFSSLDVAERLKLIKEATGLTQDEAQIIYQPGSLKIEKADSMIENVIGTYELPYAVGFNFLINGKEYVVPMVSEEPYIVNSVTKMAKIVKECGGFIAGSTGNIMISQIQLLNVDRPNAARFKILENKDKIIEFANKKDPVLVSFGGGVKDIEVRILDSQVGKMVIVHLLVDTLDAMGANAVNTMAEAVSPYLEEITGGKAYLRILSNLADRRLAYARLKVRKELLGGEKVVDGIIAAYAFADADPYRAATHNKGTMNGIIPVVMATGNDTRAIEAGFHAYAARSGQYKPVTKWEKDKNGDLHGMIEMPMAVGIVGGTTKVHPMAQLSLKILDVKSAAELGYVIAAVGLAQNFGALNSLATGGIQADFVPLHARSIAVQTGANGKSLDHIVSTMIEKNNFQLEFAQKLFEELLVNQS
jgi:hydroxymethylglutaryl-CoA reductase